MIPLVRHTQDGEIQKDRKQTSVFPGLREEFFKGNRISIWNDEKVLQWMAVTVAQHCTCT